MRTALVIAMAVLLARRAPAQDRLAIRGLDAETAARVAEIAAEASSRGLPPDPVINEARFAALYRVDGGKIVVAARGVAQRLEVARRALQPGPTADDIRAGAEALKYGISESVLRDIRKAQKRAVAVPIGLLIQLVADPTHMKVDRAAEVVLDLIRRGADTRMIAGLGNALNADVAMGTSPDKSLAFHLDALQPLLGPPSSAAAETRDALSAGSGTKKP
jgi:hypothetical protein